MAFDSKTVDIKIPDFVKNYYYAADRLEEIKTLIYDIKHPNNTKLVFQNLPRHMRRRTMTHNAKRLPRRFRQAHTAQMKKSGLPQKTKRPSRKFRRKPSNMMKEYIRRQRRNIWLETHIWHAKRFHMTEKWGYKIPLAPCDKNFRACYRATKKHALLQDISYFGCIEISGSINEIKSKFEQITSLDCGKSVAAKIYINGLREGHIEIFKRSSYPFNAIGKVSFFWKPSSSVNEEFRTLWIFSHPAFYKEILNELIELFEVQSTIMEINLESEDSTATPKYIAKDYNFNRTPKYENTKTGVVLVELKDTLNRFRLTGPLSQKVLSSAFRCKKTDENLQFDEQSNFWNDLNNITSPSELPPNMILALTIEDPRLNRPKTRMRPVHEIVDIKFNENLLSIPENLNCSSIWNANYRNGLICTMMPTHKFCELRNEQCLVPGERCEFENKLQAVSVLLIQRPGNQNLKHKPIGYGCGWDVIIPAGYGVVTWMCLIMWGARAGGLREARSINRESGCEEFFPDTKSAVHENEHRHLELKELYFRKPQNKRMNYTKFAIASPFKCPWAQLIKEWYPVSNNSHFFVIRNLNLLESLQNVLNGKISLQTINLPENSLIPVYLSLESRGNPKDYSIICMPTKCDLKTNIKFRKFMRNDPIHVEPMRNDKHENERKMLRKTHKKLLKRLRNRRIREKRKKQETSKLRVIIRKPETKQLIVQQFKKMCILWLNDELPETIRHQCSREVFGYLTQAEYSFTDGKGCGIGYITSHGFNTLINFYSKNQKYCRKKFMVLVRNPGTRNYRFGIIKIRAL